MVDAARNVAVKIAIGAFGGAKWPVDVEAKAALFPIFSLNNQRSVSQMHWRGG
jgi:hypothetical protein